MCSCTSSSRSCRSRKRSQTAPTCSAPYRQPITSATDSQPLAVLDLEREAGEALGDGTVERVLVLLRGILVERCREVVSEVGQQLGARLDGVDIVAVAFLSLVAGCAVVRALELLALADHVCLLALEEIELPRDHI